jgi:hypothetical protein
LRALKSKTGHRDFVATLASARKAAHGFGYNCQYFILQPYFGYNKPEKGRKSHATAPKNSVTHTTFLHLMGRGALLGVFGKGQEMKVINASSRRSVMKSIGPGIRYMDGSAMGPFVQPA